MSLGEGSTPLVLAPRLSERVGAEVWLKLEGANPTGSFKDRGMTCAVSAAVREGAQAVVCASTGNTAASAAAYAARAGLRCAVIVPEGKIATGKLAQALMHGAARDRAAGQLRRGAASSSASSPTATRSSLVNSVNEFRIEGQKTAAFEIAEALDGELDALCIPVGQRRQHHRLLARLRGSSASGRGCSASRPPAPRRWCTARRSSTRRRWPARSGSATRRAGRTRWTPMTSSGGAVRAVTDEQILAAYRFLAGTEGIFCEPASAASVAGLLAHGAGDAAGSSACSPATASRTRRRALAQAGAGAAAASRSWRRSSGRCCSDAGPPPAGPRAGLVRQPRARLRRAGRGAGAAPGAGGGGDGHVRRAHRARRPARPRQPASCARSSGCIPPTAFEFRIASEIPLSGGLGSSAAAIVAGLLAADHLFELDADVLGLRDRARGPSGQRRGGAGGRVRRSATGTACTGSRPPMGLEAVLVVPREPVRTSRRARGACPARCRSPTRSFNVACGGDADPGPGHGGLGADRRRAPRSPAPALPRPAVSALGGAAGACARRSGALGATISGAGPGVLVWSRYEHTGTLADALARETRDWATVMRTPFESQGAYVRGL